MSLSLSETQVMNLQLSLKSQWFNMTRDGIKTEDYRKITPYWCNRLLLVEGKKLPTSFWKTFEKYCSGTLDGVIKRMVDEGKNTFTSFTTTTLTLGYPLATDTSRIIKFEHAGIEIRTGNPEWGAEEGKLYFVIKHGRRIQ